MAQNDLPPPSASNFTQRVRETLMVALGRTGDPLDRHLTLRDLLDSGVAKVKSGFSIKSGMTGSLPLTPGAGEEVDLTPPPTPEGFVVSAGISYVFIEHGAPVYRLGHGHLRTRVYGLKYTTGDLPTFSDAVEVGQFSGTIWAMPSDPSTTWRLWIKWETNDGVLSVSPAGGTNGFEAITGQDVALLLDAIAGKITESQLFADLGERINLVDGDGLGSVNARLTAEAIARGEAIGIESSTRAQALLDEAIARGTAIQTEATARTTAIAAEALARQTLSAVVGENAAAVQVEAETRALETGRLFAKYTVKVDLNGYVYGYGLAATENDGEAEGSFAVRVDEFYIASPSGPGVAPSKPFIFRTTATTINGVDVPVGFYVADTFIQNGTITNAKIANLAVDNAKIANLAVNNAKISDLSAEKITAGFIDAARIKVGSIDAKIATIDAAVIKTGIIDSARIGDATIDSAKIADTLESTDYGRYSSIIRKNPLGYLGFPSLVHPISLATGTATPSPGNACIEIVGLPLHSEAYLDFAQFGSPFVTGIKREINSASGVDELTAYLGGNKITLTANPNKTTRARIEWARNGSNTTSLKAFLGDTQVGPTYGIAESAYSQSWPVRPLLYLITSTYVDATIGFGATYASLSSQAYTLDYCEQNNTGWRIDKQGNLDVYNGTINASCIKVGALSAEVIRSKSATEFSNHDLSLVNGQTGSFNFNMEHAGVAAVIIAVNWNISGNFFTGSARGTLGASTTTVTSFTDATVSYGTTVLVGNAALSAGSNTCTVTAYTNGATAPHIANVVLLRSYR